MYADDFVRLAEEGQTQVGTAHYAESKPLSHAWIYLAFLTVIAMLIAR